MDQLLKGLCFIDAADECQGDDTEVRATASSIKFEILAFIRASGVGSQQQLPPLPDYRLASPPTR
jgi:hypothetical protein